MSQVPEASGSIAGEAAVRRAAGALGMLAALVMIAGCETDAWLHDPSVLGRWEHTPAKTPILSRLAAIEGPEDEFVEVSDVRPEDLLPEVEPYRVGPGDILDIVVWDIPVARQPTTYQRMIDTRGFIDIPQLGQLYVNGRTVDEVVAVIEEAMRAELVEEPLVSVVVSNQRQQMYSVLGAASAPGQYFIPSPDFRLLDALTAARGIPEIIPYVYVIRQVPLSEAAAGPPEAEPPATEPAPAQPAEDLLDVIEQLTEPEQPGSPGVMGRSARAVEYRRQPERQPPPVELVEPERAPAEGAAAQPETMWMFLNGQWVQVRRRVEPPRAAAGTPAQPGGPRAEELVTQRVIRIPVKPLLAGDARYNVIIRPGDVIRVPAGVSGTVYVAGQVSRPGVYTLTPDGKLTLLRVVDAAGGLTQLGIPERVDLTRMVGDEMQATIRLNLRAIAEGTQPDLFVKANDRVNVGTNAMAFPLAVVRNGFRMTYGFGFLLDRNFGNDVFGAPPTRRIE